MAFRPLVSSLTAASVAVLCFCGIARAQSLIQAGPSIGGHPPMYVLGPGGGVASVMDSGFASGLSAAGTQTGAGLSELLQVNHSPANQSPFGTHVSFLDAPINSPGGYHGLSFDANALGGGLITYNAFGAASPLPLQICANGTCAFFPFSTTGIIGPMTTVVNDIVTWNNTSGTLVKDGAPGQMIDMKTAPLLDVDAFTMSVQSDPTVHATAIWPIGAGCVNCFEYDGIRSTVHVIAGTTAFQEAAFAAYVLNSSPLVTDRPAGVGFWSAGSCAVDNCQTWAFSSQTLDTLPYASAPTTGVGRKLIGGEIDFEISSPHTGVQGWAFLGSSVTQPDQSVGGGADAYTVGSLSAQSPGLVRWYHGFLCDNATIVSNQPCVFIGADQPSGTNVASSALDWGYFDSAGAGQIWTARVSVGGSLAFQDTGSGHGFIIDSNLVVGEVATTANSPSYNLLLSYVDAAAVPQVYQFDVSVNGILGLNDTGSEHLFTLSVDFAVGPSGPTATNATTPFIYVPTMAGMPTGIPQYHSAPGWSAITIDSADHKLCWFESAGGAWKCVTGS